MEESIVGVAAEIVGEKFKAQEKLKKTIETKDKIMDCISSSAAIFWWNFIIPIMILILILLGAVQAVYPYESTLQVDLNSSMGVLGDAFYSIYNAGLENPNWIYYFLFIFVILFYLTIDEIYYSIKRKWSGIDNMTAQDIVDTCETKNLIENERSRQGRAPFTDERRYE
jgi:hypothetical protein